MDVLKQAKEKMTAAIEHLQEELKNLRTGRANPAMLDNVMVEAYGSQMRLKDLASVTAPEARKLHVVPYDAQNTGLIGNAIIKANLGVNPIVGGNDIWINIASMDEKTRIEMGKNCYKRGEEAKISIRNARRESNEMVRKRKSDGEIPEDVEKKQEKIIQEYTDKFCKEVDEACAKKEKEILVI